ncbi:MAG: hypothetical protein ABI456_17395 [Ktedonobacteraceae bacterium]
MQKSDIPMGSEFGPNQVSLARVLELAEENAGDRRAFTEAVAQEYGWPVKTANNTPLSMGKYLLLDEDAQLTEMGENLLSLKSQPDEMYNEFARHILLHLHGLDVVNAIDTLTRAGEKPGQLTISEFLKIQGIYAPPSSTHISKLCGWLRYAGVFRSEKPFEGLDMDRVAELIGINQDETDFLAEMSAKQRAVLKALCNLPMATLPDEEPLRANELRGYTETLYGVTFNPKISLMKY